MHLGKVKKSKEFIELIKKLLFLKKWINITEEVCKFQINVQVQTKIWAGKFATNNKRAYGSK